MVSKNNVKERQRKNSDQKPRYAIKKLTIGVVSVLVGTTFAAYNGQVSADTIDSAVSTTAQTNDATPTDKSAVASDNSTTTADDSQSAADSQFSTPTSQTTISATPASTASTSSTTPVSDISTAASDADTTTESAVSRQLTISVSYEGAANNPLQETRQLTFNGIQHQTTNDGAMTTSYTWQQNHASVQTTTPVIEGYVADAAAVDQEVSLDEQGNLIVEVNGQTHLLTDLNPIFNTKVTYRKVGKVIPVAEDGTVIQADVNGAYVDAQTYQNDAADATKVTYTAPTIAGYITMQASDEGIHTPNSATDDTKIYYVPLKSTKTVTRTITYSGAGDHTPTANTYSIVFTQTNARDEQTGGLTRTWDKDHDSWPNVTVPNIDGYTPNIAEITADSNVTYQTADQNINVVYSPNQQKGQVDFIDNDDQGQIKKTVAISGVSEGQIDFTAAATALSELEKAGYALAKTNEWVDAAGTFKTAEFDTADNTDQTFNVYLVHQQATTQTNKTITRTISYTGARTNPESVRQTAVFTETIVKDLQNGNTLADTWQLTSNGFVAVDTPARKGYTPNLKTVAADSSITHTDSDQTVEVVYTPDDQKATVEFYDDTQKVYSLTLQGKTDQKIDLSAAQATLNNFEQVGYMVLAGDLSTAYTYDDEDDQDQTITVKLQQPTTSKTVHLTVNYSGAGDADPAVVERDVVFNGTISYDPTTGTTQTDWAPQTTDAAVIVTPVVNGFIASKAQIAASPDQENQTATVSYAKIGVLQAVDEAGNILATMSYQNDPNDAAKAAQTALPAVSGYVPQDGQQFILPADATQDTKVVYLPVKAQFTQNITFTGAGEKTPTAQSQTIALTDSQTSGTFTFVVPKLAGYDVKITGAAQTADQNDDILVTGATVTADSSNPASITVTYTAHQQTGQVLFVDDTNPKNELNQIALTGDTDQPIDFSQAAADQQLAAYQKAGYALSETGNDCLDENGRFKAAVYGENNLFTVHLMHQTAVINSAADAQKLVLPSGVSLKSADQQELLSENSYQDTTTASRTVTYAFSSNDSTSQAPTATDQTQTVTFNRTNSYTVDLTTGAVTKSNGDWQIAATPASDGSARLDAIKPLTFAGWYLAVTAVTDSLDAAATADDILNAHSVKPGQTQTLTLTYKKLAAAVISILDEGTKSGQPDHASLLNTYTVKGQQGANIDGDQVTEIVKVTTKDPDGKESTVTAESAANANAQLNAYLKAGYQLDQSLATVQDDNGTTIYRFDNGAVVTEKDGVYAFANQYDADDATVQSYQVYLIHGTTTATKNKTITRTINLHNVDQTTTTTVQSCPLTETIITDNVTGETITDTWNSGTWEAFTIPAVDGYVASENDLAETAVYNTTSDQVVNVIYVPNSAMATIKIIDDDAGNAELNEYQVSGTTAGQVNFNQAIAQLKKYLTGNYTFNTANKNNSAKFTIAYRDGKLDSLSAADIYGATAKEYEIHLQHQKATSKEYADMTRTINLELPTGTQIVTQTVQISRTTTTDLVTGSRSYGAWTTATWPECAVPKVPGYQTSSPAIASETVTNTTPDKSINVVYTPIVQHANITIVDDVDDTQKTTLAQADLTGTYGQAVDFDKPAISLGNVSPNGKLQEFLKNGYVLVSQESQESVASDNQHFAATVYGLEPLSITVYLKEGTQVSEETKKLTRTINYIVDGKKLKTKTIQSVDLTRTKTVNLVTGATTYSDWTTGQWDEVVSPTHKTDPTDIPDGYHPNKEIVSEQTVLHTTGNQIVLVYYSLPSDYRSATIYIIDEDDGNVTLWTQETAGKTGSSVDFTSADEALASYLNQGFAADSNGSLEHQAVNDDLKTFAQRTFADDSTQNVFKVYLKHGTKQLEDEKREVTRTINYVFPDGTTRTYVQAVDFTRTVTEDLVDDRNIYGDWKFDSKLSNVNQAVFGKLDTAQVAKDAKQDITGYVPSQAAVDELTGITEQTASQVINITFSPQVESAVIGMIDTTVAADTKTGTNDFDFQSIYTNTASGYFGKPINVELVNQYLNQFINQNGYRLGVDTQTGTAKLINDVTTDNADRSQTETLTYTYTAGNTTAGQITETITTEPATVDSDGNTITVKHYHFVMGSTAADVTSTTTATAAGKTSTVYQLAAKTFLDSTQTLLVPMLHYRTTVNYSTSNPPAGTYKDVVRTIIYHLPDNTTETKTQIVRFTRSITTDHVTGMQTASSWSTGNANYAWIETQLPDQSTTQSEVTRSSTWSSQSTPAADDPQLGAIVKGYTPTQTTVAEKQVTATTPDSVIEISYQADKQAANIQIIDSTTGDVLSNYNVHGVTKGKIDFNDANKQLNYYLTHGYLLADDSADHNNNDVQTSDGKTSFKAINYNNEDAQDQTFKVYLVHDTAESKEAVDPNITSIKDTKGNQIDYVDNVKNNPKVTNPASYVQTVTSKRTVKFVFDGDSTTKPTISDCVQTVTWTRTVNYTIDLVTGKETPTYGEWKFVASIPDGKHVQTAVNGGQSETTATTVTADEQNAGYVAAVSGSFAGWYQVNSDSATGKQTLPALDNGQGLNQTVVLEYKEYAKAKIQIIDDNSTENQGTLYDETKADGQYKQGASIDFTSANATLAELLSHGYVFDRASTNGNGTAVGTVDGFAADTYDTKDSEDQSFIIYLRHDTAQATAQLSNDSRLTAASGRTAYLDRALTNPTLTNADSYQESATSTRTVTFEFDSNTDLPPAIAKVNGQKVTQIVTYTRPISYMVDLVTGTATRDYQTWQIDQNAKGTTSQGTTTMIDDPNGQPTLSEAATFSDSTFPAVSGQIAGWYLASGDASAALAQSPLNDQAGVKKDEDPGKAGASVASSITLTFKKLQNAYIKIVDEDAANSLLYDESSTKDANAANVAQKQGAAISFTKAQAKLDALLKAGYVLDGAKQQPLKQTSFKPATFDSDDAGDQIITVYLKHGTATIGVNTDTKTSQATARELINPDSDNAVVWPDAVSYANLTRQASQTIQYLYQGGGQAHESNEQTAVLTRTVTIDKVTGKVIKYSSFTTHRFADVISPTIDNYRYVNSDDRVVVGKTASATFDEKGNETDNNFDVKYSVYYKTNGTWRKINEPVYSQDGQVSYRTDATGVSYLTKTDDASTVTATVPTYQGYTAVFETNNDSTTDKTLNANKQTSAQNQVIELHDDQAGQDSTVTYKPDPQQIVYRIYDQTLGKNISVAKEDQLNNDATTGLLAVGVSDASAAYLDTNHSQTTAAKYQALKDALVNRGYKLVSADPLPAVFDHDDDNDDDNNQTVTITVVHDYAIFADAQTAQNAESTGKVTDTAGQQAIYLLKNRDYSKLSYLDKTTATRTIKFQFSGNAQSKPNPAAVVQTVNFKRGLAYTVDLVTGDISASTPGKWEFDSGISGDTKLTDATVPAVSGKFADWYLFESDNTGAKMLVPGAEETGSLQFKHYQKATIQIIDDDQNTKQTLVNGYLTSGDGNLYTQIDLEGQQGAEIDFTAANALLEKLLAAGYQFEAGMDTFAPAKFDSDDTVDQNFVIKLIHQSITLDGKDQLPTVDNEISPGSLSQATWPKDVSSSNLTRQAERSIIYQYADGSSADNEQVKDVHDQAVLTRTVTIDKVTGKVLTTGEFSTHDFEDKSNPVIAGYHTQKASTAGFTAKAEGNLQNETKVVYYANGKYLDQRNGQQTSYTTDKDNAAKVTGTISVDPGYTAHIEQKQRTIDVPNSGTEMITYTFVPDDPAADTTTVTYTANPQTAIVQIIDDDANGKILNADAQNTTGQTLTGTSDATINFSSSQKQLDYYLNHGYQLAANGNNDIDGTQFKSAFYDNVDDVEQTFVVHLVHGKQTFNFGDPQPTGKLYSDDENSPAWPTMTLSEDAAQTIKYAGAGTDTPGNKTQTVKDAFTRAATVDLVTGKVEYSDFGGNNVTFNPETTDAVAGYHVAEDAKTAGGLKATPDEPNPEMTVTYLLNGSLRFTDQSQTLSSAQLQSIQYATDPNDPSSVTVTIPLYSGYTAQIGDQIITSANNKRKMTATTGAGSDMEVVYTADAQKAQVQIFDDDAKDSALPIWQTELSGTTAGKIEFIAGNDQLNYYLSHGYQLAANGNDDLDGTQFKSAFYDNVDDAEQTFVVHLVHGKRTFNFGDPQPTGKLYSDDENSPAWPTMTLSEDATQTIKYAGAGTDTPGNKMQTTKDAFTRAATVDLVTGKVEYSDFGGNNVTFNPETTDVVPGYHVAENAKTAGGLTATAKMPNPAITVTYYANGYVKAVDSAGEPFKEYKPVQYTTAKDDISKVENITIPTYAGYTAKINGVIVVQGLTYAIADPDKDTLIVYTANAQKAQVQIFDDDVDPKTPLWTSTKDDLNGYTDALIDFSSSQKQLDYYLNHGYQLAANGNGDLDGMQFKSAVYDNVDGVEQTFVAHLVHGKRIFNFGDPQPTGKLYSDDENSPAWPTMTLSEDATQIIKYAGAGTDTPGNKTQIAKDAFTRTATVDLVTGKVEYSAFSGKEVTFNPETTDAVVGYHVAENAKTAGGLTATAKMPNPAITVTYYANGYVKAVDSVDKPFKEYKPVQYTTANDDISKVESITIPTYAGYTAKINGQTVVQGSTYAIADPDKDTLIVYTANAQKAQVQIFDDDVDPKTPLWTSTKDDLNGYTDALIDFSSSQKQLDYYLSHGYQLAANGNDDLDGTQFKSATYDNVDSVEQTFVVHLIHGKRTFNFGDPQPTGKMYSDENSPTWPTMTLSEDATQTIKYAGVGTDTPGNKTQTAKDAFTRTATVDLVTGKVEYSAFNGNNVTFNPETTDVVPGYHVVENTKTAGGLTATPDEPNLEMTVTYLPNGSLQFTDQSQTLSSAQLQSIQYTTDPNDPSSVTVTIPLYSGYTAKIGDQIITSANNKVEMTATTGAGSDVEVVYTADAQKAQVQIFDDDAKDSALPIWQTELSGTTVGKIEFTAGNDQLKYYLNHGYQLAANGNDDLNGTQFKSAFYDNVDDVEQTFVVHLVHVLKTIGVTDSYQVGEKIYADADVTWPKLTLTKDASQTIHYQGIDGQNLADHIDRADAVFTRTATIDLATGTVTSYSEFTGQKTFEKDVLTPAKPGYHVAENDRLAGGLTATRDEPTPEMTVTYLPNGFLKARDASGQAMKGFVPVQYTTDENNSSQVKAVIIPTFAGYTAKINGVTVDQGIQYPIADAAQDTEVVYTANLQKLTVEFIDQTDHHDLAKVELTGKTDQAVDFSEAAQKLSTYLTKYVLSENNPGLDQGKFKGVVYDNVDAQDQLIKVYLEHGHKTVTESKTVTETIVYVYQNADQQIAFAHAEQTKQATRTGIQDLATGQIVWSDKIEPISFDSVASPSLTGYQARIKQSPTINVTVTNDNWTTDLDQKIEIVYDPVVQTAIVSFVDQDDLKQTFPTVTINGLSDQLIDFKAAKAQLQNYLAVGYVLTSDADLADARFDRTDAPQFFTIYLKHGQQPDQRTKQVTETIKYVYADQTQAALPVVKTITATQAGTKDLVTQQTDWHGKITFSADFAAVTSPLIKGYTADQAVIEPGHPNDTDWDQLDVVKIVTYDADPQKLTFTIRDRTTNVNLTLPNDLLASVGISDNVLATGTSDAKLDQAVAAHYQQLIKTVTEFFASQAYNDVQFEQLPAVFDHDDALDQNVVISLAHETGTVSHMVDQQKPTDDQGHQLPDSLDELLYQEESFWDYPTSTRMISYNFQTNDVNNVPKVQQAVQTVTYRRTVSYTVDLVTGQIVGEPSYGEPVYYASSTTAVFAKQDHGSDEVQTSGANDSLGTNQIPGVTGEFSGWYEELADNNGTETVLFDGSRWYVEVDGQKQFVPADQLGRIVFKRYQKARTEIIDDDDNGKQLFTQDLVGKQSATIDFQTAVAKLDELLGDGYQLADQATTVPTSSNRLQRFGLMFFASWRAKTSSLGQTAFGSAEFDTDDTNVQVFTVHVKHQKETRLESKTITRTINYHQPDGTIITIDQPATITRTVSFDKVTKQATPTTDWIMTMHPEHETPQIAGYTPDKTKVDVASVDGNSQNSNVDVVYYRNQQTALIKFVDDDRDQILPSVTIEGQLNDSIDFTPANQALDSYLNHGYRLALSGNEALNNARTAFKEAKYHAVNGVQNYVVHLTHVWQDVKEDRTIVRTINCHLPDGTVKTVAQSVTISRPVQVDQAIGTKVYGQWSLAAWQAVQVPERAGYSPSQAVIAAETVDGTSVDKTVDIYYQGHEQTASVRIIDLTAGKPLTEEKLQGLSGEPINFAKINAELTAYLAAGYILTPDNQDIDDLAMKPADFDSDDQSDQLFTVYLTHRIDEVPESKPVTRIIEYHQPDGTIKTVRETKPCQRILKIDAVTGQEVASSDWEVINWPVIVPPLFKGYTATITQSIPQNDGTMLVEVSYQAELTDDHNHEQDDHNQDADKHDSQTIHQLDQSDSHSVDSAAVSPSIPRTDKPAGMANKSTGKHSNNQRLVQTGNQATGKQTVLGSLLLGLAGMLSGLGLKKKKRGDR